MKVDEDRENSHVWLYVIFTIGALAAVAYFTKIYTLLIELVVGGLIVFNVTMLLIGYMVGENMYIHFWKIMKKRIER